MSLIFQLALLVLTALALGACAQPGAAPPTSAPTSTATVAPTSTPVSERSDLESFQSDLIATLEERDFQQMLTYMGDPFLLGFWRSEGVQYPPAEALDQLRLNYLSPETRLAFDPQVDLTPVLDGIPPLSILGPEIAGVKAIFTTGWGLAGEDEAVIYIARHPDGDLYWAGVLIALDGFSSQGTPGGEVIETEVEYVMAQGDITLHAGPGAEYAVVGQVFSGQIARVNGASVDGLWWRVACPDESMDGCWASADPEQTQPVPDLTDSSPNGPGAWIAFLGEDGNVWLVERKSGERRQVTQDAVSRAGQEHAGQAINYCCGQWSSDGEILAYRRDEAIYDAQSYQYRSALWVFRPSDGKAHALVEDQVMAGYAWKPETHLIAYGLPIDTEFFLNPSPELAQGIWVVDADTGQRSELVAAEGGYPLVIPNWSADGRFLGFDEVQYMEGRGRFAYYDFEAREYVASGQVIGFYSWSPDGQRLAFDRLAYVPDGGERIWLRDRQGGPEQAVSPPYDPGYAYHPVFAPQGDRLAYLAGLDGPESHQIALFGVAVPDGEPRQLGVFEQAQWLSWSPDGEWLLLSVGPYEKAQVVEISTANGKARVLAQGRHPAWQPTE